MIFLNGGDDKVESGLIRRLDWVEKFARIELEITSGYRAGDDGAHGIGEAADIACVNSQDRYVLMRALTFAGFRRIGIYDRHVHADVAVGLAQDVLWTGVSR